MLKWRIYYGDASSYSSEDGSPFEAPHFGVIAICQPSVDVGMEVLQSFDYYTHMGDDWGGFCGHDGLVDHLTAYTPHINALKIGRQISREQYQIVMRLALRDQDFPRRSGNHPGEKPG